MKIFGMVFALHVALACVLVLIQGCRSTAPRTAEAPAVAAAPAPTEPVSENWSSQSSTLSPTPVGSSYAPATTPAPVPSGTLAGPTPAERARTAPTRPDNPEAYISTTTPATMAAPPAAPETYVVRAGDSLWKIARAHNTTISGLQKLNPNLKADSLRPGMTIKVPGSGSPAAASVPSASMAAPAGSPPPGTAYVVKPGDSLSKVAARNGTTVAALRQANNLRSDTIQVGQTLTIPGATAATSSPGTYDPTAASTSAPAPGTGADSSAGVTYVLQRGDTLGSIAKKYDVTVRDLMAANNITDAKKVRVGQSLKIPGFKPVGSGALPGPAASSSARPPATTNPPATEPARLPETEAAPATVEPPPVQPIDEPTPAP